MSMKIIKYFHTKIYISKLLLNYGGVKKNGDVLSDIVPVPISDLLVYCYDSG
jgi:hypothetical protein